MEWAPYQLAYLADSRPRISVVKSRRIGFSEVVAYRRAARLVGFDYRAPRGHRRTRPIHQNLVSASHRQAKELLAKVLNHVQMFAKLGYCEILSDSKTEVHVRVGRHTAAAIAFSSNPRSIRGFAGDLTLDEFGNTPRQREVWKAASPLAKATLGHPRGYEINVVGTPEGDDNLFYEINRGKLSKGWSLHTVDLHQAHAQGFPILVTNEDGDLVPGTVEQLMLEEDEDTFAQEYLCSFLPASMRYISAELYDACVYEDDDEDVPQAVGACFGGLDIAGTTGAGDLWAFAELQRRVSMNKAGKTSTALWHVNTDTWKAPKPANDAAPDPHKQAQLWADQEAWADKHALRCALVGVDATGIGAQFGARFESRLAGRVQQYSFSSAPVREEVVSGLKLGLERRQVRPRRDDTDLRRDVLGLRRTVTTAGKVKVNAPRSVRGHCDRAWALAMAVSAGGGGITGGLAIEHSPQVTMPNTSANVRGDWGRPAPGGLYGSGDDDRRG